MSRRLSERHLSRAAARREMPPASLDPLEKFAEKAHDFDLVRKSVDDAASVSGALWLSYLFALFYIGIAAGAVTHKDLLLENPVELPFLNVELPLVAFFFLAPILFVISHAYTLTHFVVLAAKVGAYNKELAKQIPELGAAGDADAKAKVHETRLGLRRQLPTDIFVQFLAGPRDIREGGLGWLLKAIAWMSLVIGPVLLLLLIQVQFLPYHLEWVTWVQRLAVLADVVLLWALWPAVLGGRGEIRCPRAWRHPALTVVSMAPIALAFVVARFPSEWLNERIGSTQWIPANPVTARLGARNVFGEPKATSFHDLLFEGFIDPAARRRQSLFSNALVLPGFDGLAVAKIDGPNKLESVKHTLSFRGRRLEGAVLNGADLRKADLEGARLQGAVLVLAQLQGASLEAAQLQGASLERAGLQGASLVEAQLQGAGLGGARLQGAFLGWAQLQGASLEWAELQGVDFQRATLEGVNLAGASLWRTNFEAAIPTNIFADGLKEEAVSKDGFLRLETQITKVAPNRWSRENALKRIEILNPDIPDPRLSIAHAIDPGRVDFPTYQKALARELKNLVCSGDEYSLYVLRGLLGLPPVILKSRFSETGPDAPLLVRDILAPACPVSAALTDQDKANLHRVAKEARARDTSNPEQR